MDMTYDLTQMPAAAALAVACATTAAVFDHRYGQIPNAVTYPCLLSGFMLAAVGGGLAGIGLAFAGLLASGLIFIIAFAAGGCGGGDVKLMAALGAVLGFWPAIDVTLASLMIGGAIAVISMARRVQWGVLARTVGLFALLLPAGFRDAASVLKPRETHHTVRFGVAAASGLLWCLFMPDFTPLSLVEVAAMRAELERPFFDGAFWSSILHSRTFWIPEDHGALLGTFTIAMLLLASMLLLPRLSARRRRISELHGDTSGSTTMMDFVLVTPIFVFFMFVVFQFTILAKNHLFTHYAAYAAARSARVYFCPALPITIRSIIDPRTCDDDAAPGKADLAARLALIPAAPYDQLKCVGACQPPEEALKALADASGLSKNWRAMRNQARYMFDPQNVTVTVDRAPMALYAAISRSPHVPVTAKVEARFLLLEYAGWVFARGQRKDGRYYTISTAEVNLL